MYRVRKHLGRWFPWTLLYTDANGTYRMDVYHQRSHGKYSAAHPLAHVLPIVGFLPDPDPANVLPATFAQVLGIFMVIK